MISVIVPVYNVENYLDVCIKSIVNQSYSELEIILVNDGSTDKSGKICDDWSEKDSRIKVIHKENGGLSDARNVGIETATGEFLTFIDSDDFITESYLQYLYSLLVLYKSDMAVCQMVEVNEICNKISENKPLLKNYSIISGKYECMREFLISPLIDTVAWRKLYKTSLFSDIRFPKGKYHEDVWTTYKYIAKCNSIVIGEEHLYAYRKREGSIINSNFTPKHLDGIEGSIKRYDFIAEQYPRLSNLAAVNIIYSANQCMLRLGKSNHVDNIHFEYLRKIYRKYLKFYIFNNKNSGIIPKTFALVARYCPKLLIKAINIRYGR